MRWSYLKKETDMLTRIAVVTTILSLIVPAAGFAQGFSQGDKVLTLSGVGLSDEDFDTTTFSVSGDLSYFFTNNISGSIRQMLGFSDSEDGGSSWDATTRVAADYNFDMGRVWPFVGANIGYLYGDDVDDTWLGGPEAGVRVFVNQTTFILGMIEWQFLFDSDEEDSVFSYTLGIGFRW
jgi:hypothetical protein